MIARSTHTKAVAVETVLASIKGSDFARQDEPKSEVEKSEEPVPYISYQVLKEELVREANQITDYERYQDFIIQRLQKNDSTYITPFELN